MCECKLFYFGAFVLCSVAIVTSFNIDKSNYAIYEKINSRSMFGFTVALHIDQGDRPWILVGAPEAQSVYQHPREVSKGGAVYKCSPVADDQCEELEFTPRHNKRIENAMIDNQSNQWFGATLTTSGTSNGPVVACAPRYIWFTKDRNRRDPVGTCFKMNGSLVGYEEYSPCRTMNWGYHRQGSCQAGFSAAIDKAGDNMYIGAPGSYYWQGQMYSIDAHATFNYTPSFFGVVPFGAPGTVFQQKLSKRSAVFSTREGSAIDDDSYIGYSLVVGHFRKYDNHDGIAVGMPRGNTFRGKVLLFNWHLVNYKNITINNNQMGSYFGYSITAADVNGDKMLDIIVGAPMHTEPNKEGKYDVGRVYVFYQTDDETTSFDRSEHIDGKNSKGRFGHAVATLGDVNQDGYDDFAVGAPYDGPEGSGAVYIYYGSKDGIRESYGQVIYGSDIQSKSRSPIKTFGFSVTGGVDLDGNDYPDMAVGAYLSDSALFFRSRPTVVVDANVSFITHGRQIDITKMNCNLKNTTHENTHVCTSINFCIKYSGKGIPDQVYMSLQYVLDSKKADRHRLLFKGRGTNTFNTTLWLYKHREHCESKEVYITSNIRDKLTPLEAEVNYALRDSDSFTNRNPESQLKPVLDLNSPPSRHATIFIQKDCGADDICIPNLHLNVTSDVKMHYLGSDTDLGFDIVVTNRGEDAFETKFEMKYPKGIEFKKPEIGADMSGILCDSPFNNTITCDIGNPLPRGQIAIFRLLFQPPTAPIVGLVAPRYDFDVYVNSTNPENAHTLADNHQKVSVEIWVDASIELRGESKPPNVYLYLNESQYTSTEITKEIDIGPQVTHVYYLRNAGPSLIQEAEVYILWPFKTLADEDLLYLLEPPLSKGNVKCDLLQEYSAAGLHEELQYNSKHYQLDISRGNIWDTLGIDASEVEKQSTTTQTHNTEVGNGIASGVGVVNLNTNQTRYENTYSQSNATISKSVTSSSGSSGSSGTMYVDEYGNSRTSFEENRVPPKTSQYGGNRIKTTQHSQDFNQRNRVGGQGGSHYQEGVYESGGVIREGGVQRQNGQRQFSSGQTSRHGTTQQGSGERRQETYYEQHGSAGGIQGQSGQRQFSTGQTSRHGINQQGAGDRRQDIYYDQQGSAGDVQRQYGQRQYSSQNRTFGQSNNQGVDGGQQRYYEQRGPPAEGEVVYSRTYTLESSTVIPIDVTQLQSNPQPLDEFASGQGYRVQLIGMDNTASEISIAGTNRGIYDHSGRPAVSREEYNQSYSQGRDGSYGQGGSFGSGSAGGFRDQGGSGSSQWHRESSYSQSGRIEPTYFHNSVERDNVATDRPSSYQRHRGKRMTGDFFEELQGLEKCSSTKCSIIKCTVGTVNKGSEVAILLRSRLNVRAVRNITATQPVKLSSMMVAKVTRLPYIGEPIRKIMRKHEIFTEIPAKDKEFADQVPPLWVYVVSAVAGVIMLLLLIWILSKCGFFKRNRPSTAPERQPLNRNGYHSGDEAL